MRVPALRTWRSGEFEIEIEDCETALFPPWLGKKGEGGVVPVSSKTNGKHKMKRAPMENKGLALWQNKIGLPSPAAALQPFDWFLAPVETEV